MRAVEDVFFLERERERETFTGSNHWVRPCLVSGKIFTFATKPKLLKLFFFFWCMKALLLKLFNKKKIIETVTFEIKQILYSQDLLV